MRDRRLAVLGIALPLVLVTAGVTGTSNHAAREGERRAVQAEEARVWEHQGAANPRGAAHSGRYLFKPLEATQESVALQRVMVPIMHSHHDSE